MELNIETLLPWSDAKEINTKVGKRILRKASPTEAFWAAWNNQDAKAAMKAVGISLGKEYKNPDAWEVCWWQTPSKEDVAKQNAAIEASRAVSADVQIPVPAGLDYLPYQKAGILHMCSLLGVDVGKIFG